MTIVHLVFYFFAFIAVSSAVVVVTVRNPVHSVLALVVTFFAMAGEWMLLRAEFLSLILLLVYVGAVMTLFLFVVMMLNIQRETRESGFTRYWPLGILAVILIAGLIMAVLVPNYFAASADVNAVHTSNTKALGKLLFTAHVYSFEIAGVILLAAMIAAITLTHRGPLRRKQQNPAEQVRVRAEDRVKLINLPSEGRND